MCDRVCVVRGALSRVLRASRLLGLTPLRFTPLRDGYSVSVSSFSLLYSYAFAILCSISALFVFFLDIQALVETNSFQIKTSFYPSWGLDLIVIMIHIGINYATAKSRMREMIKNLNTVEKIQKEIDVTFSIESRHLNKILIAVALFILISFLTIIDHKHRITTAPVNKLMCYVVAHVIFTSVMALEVQMVLIYFEVHAMFQLMNKKLEQFIKIDYTINSASINNSVRNLSSVYVSGCDVVKQINEANGFFTLQVVLMWTIYVVFIELDLFSNDNSFTTLRPSFITILQILWFLYYMTKIAFLLEPCHQVYKEIDNLKFALSKLMFATPGGRQVSLEMDLFFKQTLLNEPRFEPLGVFSANRSLVTAMCGYITTYLILTKQLNL